MPTQAEPLDRNDDVQIQLASDDASIPLFTTSFDTSSLVGDHNGIRSPTQAHALQADDGSRFSLDLSPIKVNYGKRAGHWLSLKHPIMSPVPTNPPRQTPTYSFPPPPATTDPFSVLRSHHLVFRNLKYRLSPVSLLDTGSNDSIGSFEPMDINLRIALRRVEAAICAFGGTVRPANPVDDMDIFRSKKRHYQETLSQRYSVSGSHLSWDTEEHSPVDVSEQPPYPHSSCAPYEHYWQQLVTATSLSNELTTDTGAATDDNLTLQRSIGVMVYPAVNSYTAAEPGRVAPPLSQMNNFVSYESSHDPQEWLPHMLVTPETKPSLLSASSTDSSLEKSVFVDTVKLRPEHYRSVSVAVSDGYAYAPVPLSFAERKRLSDTLYHLCENIPGMTQMVAQQLHLARAAQEWDLGVAELLCQVVASRDCHACDSQLHGLQSYLQTLGISC